MNNRVCEILGIEKPVIQAPLNWLTNGRYVAAVSKAGGLGVLGFNAGQTESVYTVEETVGNMRREIRVVKGLTDKPFGINIAPTSDDPDWAVYAMLLSDQVTKCFVAAVKINRFRWMKRLVA